MLSLTKRAEAAAPEIGRRPGRPLAVLTGAMVGALAGLAACAGGSLVGTGGPGGADSSQNTADPNEPAEPAEPAADANGSAPASAAGTTGGEAGATTGGSGSSDMTGATGTTGATGMTGATGATPATGVIASLDFEDGSLGTWSLVRGSDGSPTSRGAQIVTSDHAHGNKALMIVADAQAGANSSATDGAYLRNQALWPMTPNTFYVRFYIKFATALADGHVAFLEARGPAPGQAGGTLTAVRMGGQFSMLVANLEATDGNRSSGGNTFAGDPRNAPGVKIAAGKWTCMEMLFDTVQARMQFWLEDAPIDALTVSQAADWTNAPASGKWMPAISEIELGWRGYNGQGNTVYLDDIVVAHEKIGCIK